MLVSYKFAKKAMEEGDEQSQGRRISKRTVMVVSEMKVKRRCIIPFGKQVVSIQLPCDPLF